MRPNILGLASHRQPSSTNLMKITLLVSAPCSACQRAESVWREVAKSNAAVFELQDVDTATGDSLRNQHRLNTVPAVFIDGTLVAIGVQSINEASIIIASIDNHTSHNSKAPSS